MRGPEYVGPVSIYNVTRNTRVAERVRVADTFTTRLKGLLGDSALPPGEGLLIYPCSSIHTFGMRFTLDAVFIGKDARVLRVYTRMAPWRLSSVVRGAWSVLELPSGATERAGVELGDLLSVQPLT